MDNDTIDLLVQGFMDNDVEDERCGVVLHGPSGYRAVEVPNRHDDPRNFYRIRNSDVEREKDDYERVVAVIHTHPAVRGKREKNRVTGGPQEPSYADVKQLPDTLLGIVVHPPSGTWVLFDNKVGVLSFRDKRKAKKR